LQGDITEEKNAGSETKNAIAESEFTSHTYRGVGNAGAIQIIGEIQGEKKRQQP
jgi:hypothetical protein